MRTRPRPRNFVSGELAPWLDGLFTELTQSGARRLENFIVRKKGGITRRPGTYYVDEVKTSANATILVPCVIDDDNRYVLEIGDAYIRFYDAPNHVQISLAAAAYEVTSPWSTGELTDLRWQYTPNEKALYFAHPQHHLRRLQWAADADWDLEVAPIIKTPTQLFAGDYGLIAKTDDFLTYKRARSPQVGVSGPIYFYGGSWNGTDLWVITAYHVGFPTRTFAFTSPDGEEWTDITPSLAVSMTEHMYGPAASNDDKVLIPSSTTGTLWVSSYGTDWETKTDADILPNGLLVYDEGIQYWRHHYKNKVNYSGDGLSWTTIAPLGPTTSTVVYDFASNQAGFWVAVGTHTETSTIGAAIWTASGGTAAYTTQSFTDMFVFICVAYGKPNGGNLWVAGGRTIGSSPKMYISSTALAWTSVTMTGFTSTGSVYRMAWTGDRFVGFMYDGQLITSYDGSTWTSENFTALYNTATGIIPPTILKYLTDDWTTEDRYPGLITYNEGRMILAGAIDKPATIGASKSDKLNVFNIGTEASDGWQYDLASDKNVDIQWILGGQDLVVGTRTGEGVLRGGPDAGITPSAARFLWQSTFGSDRIQPVRVNNFIIFAQRGGEIIRGYVPSAAGEAYKSPDLTAFADHIASGGIKEIDHQDDPQTIVWFVRDDGELLALTFEGETVAWSRIVTDGEFESIAIVPTSGAEDEIWAIVNRTINSATVRYLEYFDTMNVVSKDYAHFVDCGVHMSSGSAITEVTGLTHLHGEAIHVCIDGNIVETGAVVTSAGVAALSFSTGLHVHAGMPYRSYAQTMRMETGSQWGSGVGVSKRVSGKLLLWVYETIGGEFGPNISTTEAVSYSATSDLTTALYDVDFPGDWNRDGYLWIIQQDPLPMTVVGYAPDVVVGDR